MKNILIFSGGTGSIALQNSIAEHYGNNVNVDIIISAYDNGKSTGECRKAFNSKILGPSDLRKNHLTQFKIQKDLSDSANKAILKYFEYRFDAKNCEEAYQIVENQTSALSFFLDKDKKTLLDELIKGFFFDGNNYRRELKYLNFNDFSISNILYASCAAANGYSLSAAGTIMANFLGIKDNVHLISDTNLYLYAVTNNNYLITDEAEIVDWQRADDAIKGVKLLTKFGEEYIPEVDEDLADNNKCKNLIKNADIIIFSSGTQWSSLIPTYMHKNFKKYIKESNAAKYIVMNNVPDKDMFGIDAKRLLEIVNEYVDLSDFVGVFNIFAKPEMCLTDDIISSGLLKECITDIISNNHNDKKHNSSLFPVIMGNYYKQYFNKSYMIFDFDDTLWARNVDDKEVSLANISLLNKCKSMDIVSGNSINRFKDALYEYRNKFSENPKGLERIMCNGGNSVYQCIDNEFKFSHNLISDFNIDNTLELIQFVINANIVYTTEINISMFENRGNCILSIRPIRDNNFRQDFVDHLNEEFKKSDKFSDYRAYATGRTTIDIMQKSYTKGKIVNYLISQYDANDCLYIGDEVDNGNDSSVLTETKIDCVNVKDVYDTYALLKTIL